MSLNGPGYVFATKVKIGEFSNGEIRTFHLGPREFVMRQAAWDSQRNVLFPPWFAFF